MEISRFDFFKLSDIFRQDSPTLTDNFFPCNKNNAKFVVKFIDFLHYSFF
jgi:hypothetical protein